MPGSGAHHAKTGNQFCCCHCDAHNVHFSSCANSNNKEEMRRRNVAGSASSEAASNTKSELYSGIGTANHAFVAKQSVNHWWEDPAGFCSNDGTASGVTYAQENLESPTRSDLTFEGGTINNVLKDDASHASQMNSTTFSKVSTLGLGERASETLKRQVTSARIESPVLVRGNCKGVDSVKMNQEAASLKECASRWTDENGKMVIQSDVFDAILPSADEVGLQWRISELRIALRASESARMESEQETEALRKYLAEVEAAAAGFQSRVQELEHLISFSSKNECKEIEQLRSKIVMEVSKEARSQTAKAAKAVAAAREATMELDKVKRHTSSVIKAQEEEAERLRIEAAECRTLYHARTVQLQTMKEQIEKLEQSLKVSSDSTNEALKCSKEEVNALQKSLEAAKNDCLGKAKQLADMLEAFETQSNALQSAEDRLKDLEREKAELTSHNEWLEQQVSDLQNQRASGTDYDHELHKVRAMLGAEKQHLLSELAMLLHGDQNPKEDLGEWQEKCHSFDQQMSPPGPPLTFKNGIDSVVMRRQLDTKSHSHQGMDSCEYSKSTGDDGLDGHECMTPSTETVRSGSMCSCQKARRKQNINIFDGQYSSHSKGSRKSRGLQQVSSKTNSQGYNLSKDDLLAAAHREIVKLKEINQCLMDARQQGRIWDHHPEKENISQI